MEQNNKQGAAGIKKRVPAYYRLHSSLVATPIFWTAFNAFLMSVGLFAVVMANSVLLAQQKGDMQSNVVLSSVAFSLASVGILQCILHLFLARFDNENRKQRLVLFLPLMVFFAGFIVHNVFWFMGARDDFANFPSPDYVSFVVVGFVMCFVTAFSGWYQLKYLYRVYV